MHELSKKILDSYQVRKTKKQKTRFIELLKQELNEEIMIEEGNFPKSRNIIVGDLNKCQYILGAHYDTAPVLPIPNFLTPKNFLANLRHGPNPYAYTSSDIWSLFKILNTFILFFTPA